jgi:hypothetical protein
MPDSSFVTAFRRATQSRALDTDSGKEFLAEMGVDSAEWMVLLDGLIAAWVEQFATATDPADRVGKLVDLFSAGFVTGVEFGRLEPHSGAVAQ